MLELPNVVEAGLWLDVTGGGRVERMPVLFPFLVSYMVQDRSNSLQLAGAVGRLEQSHLISDGRLPRERTLRYQLRSLAYATWVARHWSPRQALHSYARHVWMGDGTHGLPEASLHYFGVPLHDLSDAQAALLVGLIQSPNAYHPGCHPERAMARRRMVLERLVENGVLSAEAGRSAGGEPLGAVASCTR
jgi:hypothetical protein